MSLICDPADHGQKSNDFVPRPNMLGLRLLAPSVGGTFTKTSVKGGGNMSAYTVSKDEGKALVTTVINANDAAEVGGNPVTLNMPEGFFVDEASQVYGQSNDAKSATQVIPANPLPDDVPYSGETAATSTPASPSPEADDNELKIDIAGSSATVFILRKN